MNVYLLPPSPPNALTNKQMFKKHAHTYARIHARRCRIHNRKCKCDFLDMEETGGKCSNLDCNSNNLEYQYLLVLTVKDGNHGADDTLSVIVAGEHAQKLFSPGLSPVDLHANTHTRDALGKKMAALKSGLIDCTLVSYRHTDNEEMLMWQMWDTEMIV